MGTMTRDDIDSAAEPLRRQMVDQLVSVGLLSNPDWKLAVAQVPRHWFMPGFYVDSGRRDDDGLTLWEPLTADLDPAQWLSEIYRDKTLITQFDGDEPGWDVPTVRSGGAPSSSSTLPSLVLRMWADADLAEDQDVLEVGTGTGYSTALYSQRYGSARLISIDIDPNRLEQAAEGLARCGFGPRLAIADGLYGYWPYAPYDRVVAACSVRRIPRPWLAQTKPGGKILTTIGGWLHGYARARLQVEEPGRAAGTLLPSTISFMMARSDEPPRLGNVFQWESLVADAEERPARHSPERLNEPSEEGFHSRFIAQLAAPHAQLSVQGDRSYLVDVTTGSAAVVRKGIDGWTVRQSGATRLWGQIEAAWDLWDSAGRPGPEQFTIEVTGYQQRIEHPTAGLSFQLP